MRASKISAGLIAKRLLSAFKLELTSVRSSDGKLLAAQIRRSRRDTDLEIPGMIRQANIQGQAMFFFIDDPADLIQRHHYTGRFYEEEELSLIARHFSEGTFVDIGANVGNHTLYAAKVLGATKVIAFEPNPRASILLRCNIALNDLVGIVKVHPLGLSNASGIARHHTPKGNLGATRLEVHPGGTLALRRGDDILSGERVDFVKIDTEGMEIEVLEGLDRTIAECQPKIFVEVEAKNAERFFAFCAVRSYRVLESYMRYPGLANYLVGPAAGGGA